MRLLFAVPALAALSLLLAAPALAQTQNASPSQEPLAAYQQMKAKCHDLAEPYLGGMLSGKIALESDAITPAMMANDAYPTAPEAVVLHGFIDAMARCEILEREFAQKWLSWDLANIDYLITNEKPVYDALANKKITYGLANRRLYDIATAVGARRRATGPQQLSQAQQNLRNAPANAALKEVGSKCLERLATFRNGLLDGKTPIDARPPTPAMLAYNVAPNDAEAQALGRLVAARQQCWNDLDDWAQVYAPYNLAMYKYQAGTEHAIFDALIAKQMTFAQANRNFAALKNQTAAQAKTIGEQQAAQSAANSPALSEDDIAKAPAQTAYQMVMQKCNSLRAPFQDGILKGKFPVSANSVTPDMLMIHDVPTDAEVGALISYVGAADQCYLYVTAFARAHQAWYLPVLEFQQEQNKPVFTALIAKKISFGEANQRFYDIGKAVTARGKAAQAQNANSSQPGAGQAGAPSEADIAGALGNSGPPARMP